MSVLPLSFYKQKTERVAKKLLGKTLVHIVNGKRLSGVITETEAYLGITDRACHTFGDRRTARTEAMYLPGGHAYVYFIYGMYNCVNVVTRTEKHPEAVLIRALEPIEGIELMKKNRKTKDVFNLTTGPGKLCQALAITKSNNAQSLISETLFIEDTGTITAKNIVARSRVGIAYALEAVHWPLRFYIKDSKYISKK